MKKLLAVFLIFVYCNCYFGCTNIEMVRQSELNTEDNDLPLMLKTADSTLYYFEDNSYSFNNDTIVGTAIVNNESKKQWVKVPVAEIKEIVGGVKRVHAGKTAIAVVLLGPLIGILLLLAYVTMVSERGNG